MSEVMVKMPSKVLHDAPEVKSIQSALKSSPASIHMGNQEFKTFALKPAPRLLGRKNCDPVTSTPQAWRKMD